MYFARSLKSLLRSLKIFSGDWRFFLLGFIISIFGASYQGIEFFRLKSLQELLALSSGIKLTYVIWEMGSWIISLVIGSLIFPAFILMVSDLETHKKGINMMAVLKKSREISYRFILLLFTYYNALFVIAGGGLLVVIVGLIDNIYYGTNATSIYNLVNNTALITALLTIGIVFSNFISLLFNIISQVMVIEGKGLIDSILGGLKLINKEFAYILTSWIIINLIMLVPLMLLSLLLKWLSDLAINYIYISEYGFFIGAVIFILIYSFILSITNIFWTEIFLNIKGMISSNTLQDLQ